MAKSKVYSLDFPIESVTQLLNIKSAKSYCICDFKDRDKFIEYSDLKNMTFDTVVSFIANKKLYVSKVIERETVKKVTTKKSKPILIADVSKCKTSLDDIYGK